MSKQPAASTGLTISLLATVVGLVLAALPLALWIAWTPLVFVGVLITGVASVALLVFLLDYRRSAVEEPADASERHRGSAVPDEFVEEIHRIMPLTYHHGRMGRGPFRGTMEKLRRLIR